MIAKINLREINATDRYAPDAEYTHWKAQRAVSQRPSVYRIDGDFLVVDTTKAALSVEKIKDALHWGYQWNSWEI